MNDGDEERDQQSYGSLQRVRWSVSLNAFECSLMKEHAGSLPLLVLFIFSFYLKVRDN